MLAFLLILALDATPAQQHPGTWCRVAALPRWSGW